MVWFRVDDGFPTSRKVLSIPKRRRAVAVGVWTMAGAWCARELTDGTLPRYALDEIPNGPQAAPDLVSSGLWREVGTDFVFHDWAEYQPSKAEVLKERADHAARQKAYRDRKKAERDASRNKQGDASRDAAVTVAVTPARPDPTRPDPTVVPTELPREVKDKALEVQNVDADFERFWSTYPKRVARRAAEKAWVSALKRATFEQILAGAKRYAEHPDVWREDGKFIKAPATWLNADCWTDEIPPARPLGAVGGKLSTADERAISGAALVAHFAVQEETNHQPQIGA